MHIKRGLILDWTTCLFNWLKINGVFYGFWTLFFYLVIHYTYLYFKNNRIKLIKKRKYVLSEKDRNKVLEFTNSENIIIDAEFLPTGFTCNIKRGKKAGAMILKPRDVVLNIS